MEARPFEVRMYIDEFGRVPFAEWCSALADRATAARIQMRITRVRAGLLGACGFVGDGVYELKIQCGPGYRIYFGFSGPHRIVLLLGGTKQTQDRDIGKARIYWASHQGEIHEA
ncbi:MAG TPA: addiction module killer protein [Elusimicrobia bacterium]|nr:MAG: addiction module killer protein [Rhodocyclales bacterium GWA2_65_19]HBL18293.1 addiction module killer protein [Elusimicrobiota bacterium]